MTLEILGAVFVITACGSVGFKIAAAYRREERTLRNLIMILDYMECELQYRMTPLPALCRQASAESGGVLSNLFLQLSAELEDQISPDVDRCMHAALNKVTNIPRITLEALKRLGHSLGRFDMDGQLRGLESVRQDCRRNLKQLEQNGDTRLRSYQTLGLCAGAAMVILFI